MKKAGLLSPSTDPDELAKRAWLDLDGVTDDWIQALKMPEVAENRRPARLDPVAFARLWDGGCLCCARGCCLDQRIRLGYLGCRENGRREGEVPAELEASGSRLTRSVLRVRGSAGASPSRPAIFAMHNQETGSLAKHLAVVLAPVLVAIAGLLIHVLLPDKLGVEISRSVNGAYPALLAIVGTVCLLLAVVSVFWLRRAWRYYAPLVAGALAVLGLWELITQKLAWIPPFYFPGPDRVLGCIIDDRAILFESTVNSLLLLLTGYAVGAGRRHHQRHPDRLVPGSPLLGDAGPQGHRAAPGDGADSRRHDALAGLVPAGDGARSPSRSGSR